MKKLISTLLCITLLAAILPLNMITAFAEENQPYSIDNGYIKIQSSKQNGGFVINTSEGDLLKKSDNNKKLLFHSDEYDTSFVSYRVTFENGSTEDYIFGGKYGGLTDPSHSGVIASQAQANGDITAVWSVGNLTFTQVLSLENTESNEHGMVSVSLSAENKGGAPVSIKSRILLDTYLGGKDFGFYQAVDENSVTHTITTEQILDGSAYPIPQNFYATDDAYNPAITAYTVNNPSARPYQVAFGHWNNLASTLFDFAPDSSMNFTSAVNDYLTSDSAYALYYDMGSVAPTTRTDIVSYYGVYSHNKVSAAESVAVDATVPFRLDLNDEKSDYIRLSDVGIADFSAGVNFENYASGTAKKLESVVLSVKTTANIKPLSDSGEAIDGVDFNSDKPFTVSYSNVNIGDIVSKTLYFDARLCESAAYERITIGVYDVLSSGGAITEENKLGEKTVYILLPGSDGSVPKVSFASMTPKIIYTSGTRHLFATVTNPAMLDNRGNWDMKVYSVDGKTSYDIAHEFISINDGVMDIALTDDIRLAAGSWYFQLEWTDAAVNAGVVPQELKRQTAPELNFTISEDKKYKNDSYGILAVVELIENNESIYRIKSFKDEAEYKTFEGNKSGYEEILLTFRGEFIADKYVTDGDGHREQTYYTAISTKTLDETTREYKVDNCININGCMDFEGGTMKISYEDYKIPETYKTSPVLVEFDGDLLTSNSRTSIWKGKAAFTKIEQKTKYSLIKYDKNGNRDKNKTAESIMLIWPSVFGTAQTLAGLVFNMAYGELGAMYDDSGKEIGRVISFSANLDLSFASPNANAAPKDTYWSKFQEMWQFYREDVSLYQYAYNPGRIEKIFDWSNIDEGPDTESKQVTASVMVRDILFGCGEGFVGMNFKVTVGIQNYIDALPKVTGTVEVNTVNDWAFKLAGGFKLATFSVEARLAFKSHNNVPVPDDIYFYMGGFKPGINVDGFGVLWITGGGGGISNLYDTIFMTKTVPPLKLILSVGFSIVQVLDGKATLSVGATGISLTGEELKIFGVIEAIKRVYLGLEWYPGIDLKASISVNLFQGVIKGGGYIVLIGKNYTDWFFEMYCKASISIPGSVPLFGGMEIASADLGINTEKIWGGIKVVTLDIGITYYWGESSVHFGSGSSKTQPTYPSLLGQDDIPVYFDAERNQTLYARFGTNISTPTEAEVIDNSGEIRLMSAGLSSDEGLRLHRFNLGEYNSLNNNAAIIQVSFDAESLEDAKQKAQSFKVNESKTFNGTAFPVVLYANGNESSANANITYDETTKKAAYCIAASKAEYYDKDWYVSTGDTAAKVVMYNVMPLPSLESLSAKVNGSSAEISFDGSKLGELDKISFFLAETNDAADTENMTLITTVEDTAALQSKKVTVNIPKTIKSGDYYVRAVYSKTDEVNGVIYSTSKVHYTNADVPSDSVIKSFTSGGNLEFKVGISDNSDGNTKGYLASVYNEDKTLTEVSDLKFDKLNGSDTVFNIGGSYEYDGEMHGLKAGNKYYVGVKPYNLIDMDNNGENDTAVYGNEIFSEMLTLPKQTTPTVSLSADKELKQITYTSLTDDDGDPTTPAVNKNFIKDVYSSDKITFTANISELSSGSWWLDTPLSTDAAGNAIGTGGKFTDKSTIEIPLDNIASGSHTLNISGTDNEGDTFTHSYVFETDAQPPRLMLSSPVNGSLYNADGTLTVSGVTDADAYFTIMSDGEYLCSGKTVSELGGSIDKDGIFSFNVSLYDPNGSSHKNVVITATDMVGNFVTKEISVTHGGLARLKDIQILADGNVLSSGNIPVNTVTEQTNILTLAGLTTDGVTFMLDGANASWYVENAEGSAEVDSDGRLTLSNNAQGIVTGRLEVADKAFKSATLCYGAAVKNGYVAVSSSVGGSVSGGGVYNAGDSVTLTATPDNGYVFAGWTITGASVSDAKSQTISFTMPSDGNVTAAASFKAKSGGGSGSSSSQKPSVIYKSLKAGELASIALQNVENINTYVPYYVNDNNEKVFVQKAAVIDNKLVFIAPVDAAYYCMDNSKQFEDTASHWAADSIDFNAARTIFSGVENNNFAPDLPMTRAMLVTVLYRLSGSPEVESTAVFNDVEQGSWYEKAVSWGSANDIVFGMGENEFAPNEYVTREQLCTLIERYNAYEKIELPKTEEIKDFVDSKYISGWAEQGVNYCVETGMVNGYPDDTFAPQGTASRAENCTIIKRLIESLIKSKM